MLGLRALVLIVKHVQLLSSLVARVNLPAVSASPLGELESNTGHIVQSADALKNK